MLERDQVMIRFQKVTALLEQALSEIPYRSLEISDELQEQVHKEREREIHSLSLMFDHYIYICLSLTVLRFFGGFKQLWIEC